MERFLRTVSAQLVVFFYKFDYEVAGKNILINVASKAGHFGAPFVLVQLCEKIPDAANLFWENALRHRSG